MTPHLGTVSQIRLRLGFHAAAAVIAPLVRIALAVGVFRERLALLFLLFAFLADFLQDLGLLLLPAMMTLRMFLADTVLDTGEREQKCSGRRNCEPDIECVQR